MAHLIFLLTALLALANAYDADPSLQVDNYLFAPFNQTNDIGARSGAVIGSSADFGTIYVLGGEDNSGAVNSNFKFDLKGLKWTSLPVNFSRTGACYAQDSNRNGIWIFGGVGKGNNSEPFLQYTFILPLLFSPLPLITYHLMVLAVWRLVTVPNSMPSLAKNQH
jgi:hypothetical protein